MAGVPWVIGSVAGGLAGGLVWVLVGYYSGYEVGYIAWGIGLLTGLGTRWIAQKSESEESRMQGIGAAVVAVASIVGAKYVVAYLQVENARNDAKLMLSEFRDPVDDDSLIAVYANDIVRARIDEGNAPEMASFDNPNLPAKFRFPDDIWKEATAEFRHGTDQDREELRKVVAAKRAEILQTAEDELSAIPIDPGFGPWDLLWSGLAIVTAFKVGAGSQE